MFLDAHQLVTFCGFVLVVVGQVVNTGFIHDISVKNYDISDDNQSKQLGNCG